MKSHIVVSVMLVHQPGNDMFAGMLLHEIKALCPIYMAGYRRSNRKQGTWSVSYYVSNDVIFDLHIHYGVTIQGTFVSGLPTFLREKCGA